jgi:hypothetical protein
MDYGVLNRSTVVEDDELIRCPDLGDDEWDQLMDEYPLEVEEEEEEDDSYEDSRSWAVFLDTRPNGTLRMFYEVVGVPPDIVDKLWWRVEDWWMEHKHELLKHTILDFLWLLSYMRVHGTLQQSAFSWKKRDGKGPSPRSFRRRILSTLGLVLSALGSVRPEVKAIVRCLLRRENLTKDACYL